MPIRVYPIDWYEHFSLRSPVCTMLSISLSSELRLVTSIKDADIVLIGAYGTRHKQSDIVHSHHAWKLFVTGENQVPDLRYYDHSLSFCRFDFDGRNFRWPIWYQSLSLDGVDSGTFTPSETDLLVESNRPIVSPERRPNWNRIVAIFNNCEPLRCHVFDRFKEIEIIDGVGAPFDLALPWGDENTYRPKIEVLSQYGFNLCFENSISDGYYTEKVLHARASGCVPLIYADHHMSQDFDLSSCINLYDFDTVDDFCNYVHEVSHCYDRWLELASGPVFSKKPDFESVKTFIRTGYESFTIGRNTTRKSNFDHMKLVLDPPRLTVKILKKLLSMME